MFKGKILCELIHSPVVSSHWVLWIDSQRISQSLLSILYMSIITLTRSWLKKSAVLQLPHVANVPTLPYVKPQEHKQPSWGSGATPSLSPSHTWAVSWLTNLPQLLQTQNVSAIVTACCEFHLPGLGFFLQNPKHLLRRYLEWFVWPSPTLQSSTITIQSSWHYERTPTHSNRNTCVWNAVNECGLGDWNAETLSDHVFQTSQNCILRLESWNLIRRS